MNQRRHFIPRFIVGALSIALGAPAAWADGATLAFNRPDAVERGSDWDISGSVLGGDEVSQAQCHYRTAATDGWVRVRMVAEADEFFRATVPSRDLVPPMIEFYCEAKDYYGKRFDLLASESSPERLDVVAPRPKKAKRPPVVEAEVVDEVVEESEVDAASEVATAPDASLEKGASAADAAFDADDEGDGKKDTSETSASAKVVSIPVDDENDSREGARPSEREESREARSSSFESSRHATASVKEMPSEDLAAGETPSELDGTLPPASEMSSSRNIQTTTRRTVTDIALDDDAYAKEAVVTVASRKGETVTLAPAIVSSVSDEEMRGMGLQTVPDVLKTIPGLETSRDVQGFHKVAVRGILDDGALLVMYDGHRLNSSYDARPMMNLSTDNLEQVEVLRGPGSALHGTGATLGTINLISKRKTGFEGSVMGGLEGTAAAHVAGGLKLGESDWYLFGDASYRRTDGYREEIKNDAMSSLMQANGYKREDAPAGITDDHGQWVNVGVEARRSSSGGAVTRAFARFLYEDRGALVGLFDVVGKDSELSWMAILADVTHSQPFDIGTLNLRLYFDHQSVDRRFQTAPANYVFEATGVVAHDGLFEETKFSTQNIGASVAMDFKLGDSNILTVGVTGELQRLPSYSYALNFDQSGHLNEDGAMVSPYLAPFQEYSEVKNRLVGAVILQDFWQLHSTFALTAGVRLDVTQLPETAEKGGQTVPEGSRFVPSVNPRVSLVWSPAPNWTVKLLYGRAFRAPTMQELAEQIPEIETTQGRSKGNPELSPATVDTVEAGIETTQSLGMSRVRIRANGFFNNLSNPIMAVDSTGNVIPLENRDLGVRVFGAEGELKLELGGSRAYTFVNCSWFRAEDQAAYDGFQYLTNVPQIRFNWGALIPIGHYLNLSLLAQYGAERRNNARSILEAQRSYTIPPYILLGTQLSTKRIADLVEIALTLRNVFDFKTYDEVPRPDSGRMSGLLPREGFGAFLSARFFY